MMRFSPSLAVALILCFGELGNPTPDLAAKIAAQLQIEYGQSCSGNEDCREWITILEELVPDNQHDAHPSGQQEGERAGSALNSKRGVVERMRELLPRLRNRAVRKEIERLLEH